MAYHWRDNWYFSKDDLGNVSIEHFLEGLAPDVEKVIAVIPPDEWASIVAAVSRDSGTSVTYAMAKALHGG